MAEGFGNTFMVVTGEGNVIIDTSLSYNVKHHKRLLRAIDEGPIKYIILTHAHADHTGGVKAWKEKGTEIIAQENAVEFLHYKGRLASFFALRNEAQFGFSRDLNQPPLDNYGASIDTTILFDDKYELLKNLWRLIYTDKTLDKYEDHLIKMIGGMLQMEHRQIINAKMLIRKELNIE